MPPLATIVLAAGSFFIKGFSRSEGPCDLVDIISIIFSGVLKDPILSMLSFTLNGSSGSSNDSPFINFSIKKSESPSFIESSMLFLSMLSMPSSVSCLLRNSSIASSGSKPMFPIGFIIIPPACSMAMPPAAKLSGSYPIF